MKLALIVVTAVLLATPAAAKDPISSFIDVVILSSKSPDGLQRKTPNRRPTANEVVSRSDRGVVLSADPDQRIRTKLGRELGEQDAE